MISPWKPGGCLMVFVVIPVVVYSLAIGFMMLIDYVYRILQ